MLGKAGEVDDRGFNWVKVREERPTELVVRLPPEPVDSNGMLLVPLTAIGIAGKRCYMHSVPDLGHARARRPPIILRGIHSVSGAGAASIREAPGDCKSG